MKRFIFLTSTMFNEPPRMRHQLAEMLIERGHEVVFFQKPLFFFQRSAKLHKKKVTDRFFLDQSKQLIHHQLRVFDFLADLNAKYECNQLRKINGQVRSDDIIVNFNYDYYFLRRLYRNNKIISVINDDFVAQAKFRRGRHVRRSLSELAKLSDAVLTVSYPLVKQLSEWCDPALFLPWADSDYIAPLRCDKKNGVLIWASINNVIDYELIKNISLKAPHFDFYLIGPLARESVGIVKELTYTRDNVRYCKPAELDDLPLERFFVGLMPYASGVLSTEAVTLANKSFRLLSRGLPLVVHGMPNFFEHSSILKCKDVDEMFVVLSNVYENFWHMQNDISRFVQENTADKRYSQFIEFIC